MLALYLVLKKWASEGVDQSALQNTPEITGRGSRSSTWSVAVSPLLFADLMSIDRRDKSRLPRPEEQTDPWRVVDRRLVGITNGPWEVLDSDVAVSAGAVATGATNVTPHRPGSISRRDRIVVHFSYRRVNKVVPGFFSIHSISSFFPFNITCRSMDFQSAVIFPKPGTTFTLQLKEPAKFGPDDIGRKHVQPFPHVFSRIRDGTIDCPNVFLHGVFQVHDVSAIHCIEVKWLYVVV